MLKTIAGANYLGITIYKFKGLISKHNNPNKHTQIHPNPNTEMAAITNFFINTALKIDWFDALTPAVSIQERD